MKIICYSIKHLKPVERTNLQRELYGFKDISNKGQYVYRRPGLLDTSNHKKVFFTGIVVKDKKAEELLKILNKYKAKIHITSASSLK